MSSSKKGKEKVFEVESRRRSFTRSDSKKMMDNAMKVTAESTVDNRRNKTFKVSIFQIPLSDVVEVSGAESKEGPDKEIVEDLKQSSNKKGDGKKPKE